MNTLALQVQQGLGRDPHAGEIFCFRGRKGDLVKLLWHDGVTEDNAATIRATWLLGHIPRVLLTLAIPVYALRALAAGPTR